MQNSRTFQARTNMSKNSSSRGCLQFVIVVFPDHTHLLFLKDSKFLKHTDLRQKNCYLSLYKKV